MKTLVFADGSTMVFTDESVITDLVTVTKKFADIDAFSGNFTEENLEGATFDGEEVHNLIPLAIKVSYDLDGGNLTVRINSRFKTDVELLQESMAKAESNIDYIAMETDVELEEV